MKLRKKIIILHKSIYVIPLLVMFIFSCGTADKEKMEKEGNAAFTNFQEFIAETENNIDENLGETEAAWAESLDSLKERYQRTERNLDEHFENYGEEKRQEVNDLKRKFNEIWQKKQKDFEAFKRKLELRAMLFLIEVNTDNLSGVSAANIRLNYDKFVTAVENNQDSFTETDWEVIENYWNNLNERLKVVGDELNMKDRVAIEQQKLKYQAIKTKKNLKETLG